MKSCIRHSGHFLGDKQAKSERLESLGLIVNFLLCIEHRYLLLQLKRLESLGLMSKPSAVDKLLHRTKQMRALGIFTSTFHHTWSAPHDFIIPSFPI